MAFHGSLVRQRVPPGDLGGHGPVEAAGPKLRLSVVLDVTRMAVGVDPLVSVDAKAPYHPIDGEYATIGA